MLFGLAIVHNVDDDAVDDDNDDDGVLKLLRLFFCPCVCSLLLSAHAHERMHRNIHTLEKCSVRAF